MTVTGKNRIMIFGPKDGGAYVVEFRTAAVEALAISIPRCESACKKGSDSILMKFGIRVELDSGESAPCNKHFAAPA